MSDKEKGKKTTPGYEDGTVVQGPGTTIYIIEKGKKRAIPDVFTYVRLGVNADEIVHLKKEVLEAIPGGVPIPRIKPRGKK